MLGERRFLTGRLPKAVIPAQAGIHFALDAQEVRWMPACAGMTFTAPFGQQALTGAAHALRWRDSARDGA